MAKSDEILRKATEILSSKAAEKEAEKMQLERERRELIASIGGEVAQMLTPTLEKIAQANQVNADMIRSIISEVKIDAPVMPEIKLPPINVPRPNVTVKAPDVRIPPPAPINIPETKFPERMRVEMEGVDKMRPLPVMMMDTKGRPLSMGASGGKADYFTIKDIITSTGASIINDAGELKTSASVSVGDVTVSQDYGSGEIGAETVRMVMATDAIASVNIVSGSASGTEYADGDTASTPNGAVAMGDTGEESANVWALATFSGVTSSGTLRTVQAVDSVSSTNVVSTVGLTDTELRTASVPVEQVSGSVWSTNVTNSVAVEGPLTDAELRAESVPVSQVSGAVWSTNVTNTVTVDGSGVTQPVSVAAVLPVSQVSGANWSVSVVGATATIAMVGDLVADAADTGSAPVKTGGIARQANPTAVAAGDRVSSTHDDLGRQVMRPMQVRDLMRTAYVSLTNGTETTFLAASAGNYHDLVYVMGANNSDAAVSIDIRAVTGGNIVMGLQIPANGTAGVSLPTPYPQDATGNNWTVDMGDITGTTVKLSGLFSLEV